MNPALLAGAMCQIVLVGDSTLAEGSGYGPSLCAEVIGQCTNFAVGGTTSMSFRDKGYWLKAVSHVSKGTVVLIEFGHNDRWTKDPNKFANFEHALGQYVRETRSNGGVPVIVTPLTERRFVASNLYDDLKPWADRAKQVAQRMSVPILPLHEASVVEVQRLGPVNSMKLAELPPSPEILNGAKTGSSPALSLERQWPRFDYTHLGPAGASMTASIVKSQLSASGWSKCFRLK